MTTDPSTLPTAWLVAFGLMAVWELVWKGLALWRAAKRGEKAWFVILLVVNTAGILPILYLLLAKNERHEK